MGGNLAKLDGRLGGGHGRKVGIKWHYSDDASDGEI